MKRDPREMLAQTDLRFWGIGCILILLAVLSLSMDLAGDPKKRAGAGEPGSIIPAVYKLQQASPTPTPTAAIAAVPSRTPFPEELLANYQQTTGIIIFAGVLVLIIVGGVFFQLLNERKTPG
jgi:hypothetical protein